MVTLHFVLYDNKDTTLSTEKALNNELAGEKERG